MTFSFFSDLVCCLLLVTVKIASSYVRYVYICCKDESSTLHVYRTAVGTAVVAEGTRRLRKNVILMILRHTTHSFLSVCVIRLRLGWRLVNLLPVPKRPNAFTNGVVDRPWVVGLEFESHVHHDNAFKRTVNFLVSRI